MLARTPKPTTMEVLDRCAAELAAKGPLFADIPKDEPLPGVTHYGRVFDQPKYTAAVLKRLNARRAR